MTTTYKNDDLFHLINEAHQAFSSGSKLKASALRAKINIKLRKRGHEPAEFWKSFQQAAEFYATTMNQ
tara:strand:+ start:278 stop:481 length:204 start_codon:yes stop_codon:yes gene_type:complete